MNSAVRSSPFYNIVFYAALLLCCVIFLFPLYTAVINSLNEFFAPAVLFPKALHLENYHYAWTMIEFWKYALNSVIICSIMVVTSTFTSGMVGYAFARLEAPGRNVLFMILLSTMMVPALVTQIPTYLLFHRYGLLNTFIPWLLWGVGGSSYFIFFYRQFFAGIPKEMEEAARIDGCSIFRTYWNIFIPLSIPVVVTVSILTFQFTWGDIAGPFMFLKRDHYPLATALSMLSYTQGGSNVIIQPVSIAGGLLSCIPVLFVFFLGQKYVVEGIVASGIKG